MGIGKFIVGARNSQLSVIQTGQVMDRLRLLAPGVELELKTISTAGDRNMSPAALFDHQGIFVKEIEEALLEGQIDIAVHSLKDMPSLVRSGLDLAAVSERVDPRDALITCDGTMFRQLKLGARVGTSSVRRRAQILHARPDLKVADMRGNVDTRLRKVREGAVDALIIACAGILRLGEEKVITERLPLEVMLPAPCQGVLALETRADDARAKALANLYDHAETRDCINCERAFLGGLGGGCSLPVGALARMRKGRVVLTGEVVSPDGKKCLRRVLEDVPQIAQALGARMAKEFLASDGDWIRQALRSPFPGRGEK